MGRPSVRREDLLAEIASWPAPRRVAEQAVDEVTSRAIEFCRARPGRISEEVVARAAALAR